MGSMNPSLRFIFGFLALLLSALLIQTINATVSYDHKALIINGKRRILISGSIHYPRSTPEVNIFPSFF